MSARQAAVRLRSLGARLGPAACELSAPPARFNTGTEAATPAAAKTLLFSRPNSLRCEPTKDADDVDLDVEQLGFFRRVLLRLGGYYSAESTRMRASVRLNKAVLAQADSPEALKTFNLPADDFRCRFAFASLHLWLSLVRLRSEGDAGKLLGQELYDHFWAEMEGRVRGEGVVVRLSKWMRELEGAFYGSSAAYDNALAASSGGLEVGQHDVLASALRRNVQMGEGLTTDSALLARYVRHQLACLAATESEAVMRGHISFAASGWPSSDAARKGGGR